jgi:hypothetical protein
MSAPRTLTRRGLRERGHAILLTLVVIATGVTLLTYGASADVARRLNSDAQTERVLALAKQALIARAVADANRPGSLPCPDPLNNGNSPGLDCGSLYIGRLPWRTLGLEDLRDASGERLWYVLSPNFTDATGVRINSDTRGTLTVYGGSTAHVLGDEVAALIIAPGSALGGQLRDAAVALCPATGTESARELCPSNYLEGDSSGGWNNATANGPHMSAQGSTLFNDRVAVLRTSDFMPLVEQRIARELRDVLLEYQRAARLAAAPQSRCDHGCFPWPDSSHDGRSDPGENRGRIPLTAEPHDWGTRIPAKISVELPRLPAYFASNRWQNVVYYTVAKRSLQNSGNHPDRCVTCVSEMLSVDAVEAYEVVLITPGAPMTAQTRTAWSHYITDPRNSDDDDAYFAPQAKVLNRNRLFAIAGGAAGPAGCRANAQALLQNAPCHTTGLNVKAACRAARENLEQCSCRDAAQALIEVPCRNTLAPSPHCEEPIRQLQVCT